MCILPGPFFEVYEFGRFSAHPYQHYPELPLKPLKERDGVLNKKAIFFRIKWGLKMSFFLLKRGNLIWNGLPKRAFIARYTQTI